MDDLAGAYTTRYQRSRKRRKQVDQSLLSAITCVMPPGCTIIDIGAGGGMYVAALRELGYTARGVDGTPGVEKLSGGLVDQVNLTGDCKDWYGVSDWGLFLEVGEHVPRELERRLLDEVSRMPALGLIVSWGSPGQRGFRHVNCRKPEHVAAGFAGRGWSFDGAATRRARRVAGRNYRKRLLVFTR